MELRAEDVKNIRSIEFCKEILRQAIEQIDKLNAETDRLQKWNKKETKLHMDIERRQKYKRCFAMAKQCKESLRLMRTYEATDDYWNLEPGHDAEYFFKKGDFYSKWSNRWLKIAEQFKEAKCR